MSELALLGGEPVRQTVLPYARQLIDDTDVQHVVDCLRSDYLTTGPRVRQFEQAICEYTQATNSVALSSGTAALHAAMYAIDIQPGDEVIVPAITFAATANCVRYCGATVVFADVDERTLLINCDDVEARISENTKAIIAVDYAGQPCDYNSLQIIAKQYGLYLIADACHALGAQYHRRPVGTLADITVFSFHPVKHITTAEGGMLCSNDSGIAQRAREFRQHGIDADGVQRETRGTWHYDMRTLGFNYRLSDLQCALGVSQLSKIDEWIDRRNTLAGRYRDALSVFQGIIPLACRDDCLHAYHLFVVQAEVDSMRVSRDTLMKAYRAEGIGVNVHYKPVYLHSYYRDALRYDPGLCPIAEKVYAQIISLPLFNAMHPRDLDDVVRATEKIMGNMEALRRYQV